MIRVARRVGVLSLALAASPLVVLSSVGSPAAATPTPATVAETVIPVTGTAARVGRLSAASSAAGVVAWQTTSRTSGDLLPLGSSTWRRLPAQMQQCNGSRFVRDAYAFCEISRPTSTLVRRVDLATLDLQDVTLPGYATFTVDADAPLRVSGNRVLRTPYGGTTTTALDLTGTQWTLRGVAADSQGMVVTADSGGVRHVLGPDLTDLGTLTGGLALRGDRLVVVDSGSVVVRSRTDGSELGRVAVGAEGISGGVVAGQDGVAWVDSSSRLVTVPLSSGGVPGAPARATGSMTEPSVASDPVSGFLVSRRDATAFAHVPAGSTTSDRALAVPAPPRQVVGVALGGDRLTTVDDRAYSPSLQVDDPGPHVVAQRPLTGTSGAPVVGAETLLPQRAESVSASAGRLLLTNYTGVTTELWERGHKVRGPVPTSYVSYSLAPVVTGSTIVVGDHAERADGTPLAPVPSTALSWATDGRYVAWATSAGGVMVRDLRAAVTPTNPRRLQADVGDCFGPAAGCAFKVGVGNGRVAVVLGDGQVRLMAMDGSGAVTLPQRGTLMSPPVFGDGWMAWARPVLASGLGGWTVELLDLRTPGATAVAVGTVPELREGNNARLIAAEGDRLAWVGEEGVHVGRVSVPRSSGWSAVGLPAAAVGMSPNGDRVKDTWALGVDLDRPASSATVVVSDASGRVVRRLTTSAPDSSVRVVWDGRSDSGAAVPDGRYDWQLQTNLGSPSGGRDLKLRPTTWGSLRVARSLAAPRLTVPVYTSDWRGDPSHMPISWTATGIAAPVVYDVQTSARNPFEPPRDSWGYWYPSGGATSTTVDVKPPVSGVPMNFRYRVRARDAVGNVSAWATSPVVVSTVDQDQDGAGVERTGTWTRVADSAAYLGAYRRTSARGAATGTNGQMSTFALIGRRCPTCSSAQILVDGTVVATVDTRGDWSERAVLGRVRVSSGWHQVLVRNLATSGRPWLLVDGFAPTP